MIFIWLKYISVFQTWIKSFCIDFNLDCSYKKWVYYLLFSIFHQYVFFSCSILWPVFTGLFSIITPYIRVEARARAPLYSILKLKMYLLLAFQTTSPPRPPAELNGLRPLNGTTELVSHTIKNLTETPVSLLLSYLIQLSLKLNWWLNTVCILQSDGTL